MRVRCLTALGVAAAAAAGAALAEPSAPSYTIGELQALARSAHPSLDAVEAGIEAAAGALRQAGAYPNPQLELSGGRGRPRDGGGDARSESALELLQPIELPGVRKWRARLAEQGRRGAELERAVAGSLVDATVARLAYTILGDRRRVDIARKSAGVAARLHDLLARRVELGESPPLEAIKARSEWFARRRDVLDAESSLAASRSALDVFCGGRLAASYEIVEPIEDDARALPADLVERLRASNPLLARAEVAIAQAGAAVEHAKSETLPRIDLLARHENELDRNATSVGVGFAIPIWSRNRGAIEGAQASRRRATSEAAALGLELERELVAAAAEHERARAALGLHREGWTAAAGQALEIATFSFENGEASLLEVLDAQRAQLEVALAEAQSWTALHLARAEIERLIGGPLERERNDESR